MLSNCTLNTNMTDQAWRSSEALDFNSRLLTLIDLFFAAVFINFCGCFFRRSGLNGG